MAHGPCCSWRWYPSSEPARRRLTTRESTRGVHMTPRRGPFWTHRRSMTRPRTRPRPSTTRLPSSSLARMAASRDSRDDVVVDPAFEGIDGEFGSGRVDADVVADLRHVPEVDARRIGGVGQPGRDRGEPVPK